MNRERTISLRVAEAPERSRNALTRAFNGSASPRQAIKAQCLSGVGFDRAAVRDCTGYSCPLWMYRPFQSVDAPPEPPRDAGRTQGAGAAP